VRRIALVFTLSLGLLLTVGCEKDSSKDKPKAEDKKAEDKKAEAPEEKGPSAQAKKAEAEAKDALAKLHKSASVYYTMPRVARETGMKLPCQFPANQDWTPSTKACDGKDKRYEVQPNAWTTPTWSALNFQVNDAHYAQFKVTSSGTMATAKVTFQARVDPDCTGKYTVYSTTVSGDPNATMAECAAGPASKVEVTNE